MEYVHFLIDFLLHIDVHLAQMVAQYGVWVYAILFAIIFCETGLVVTPFLPGDSLLFVGGALAALPTNELNVHLLVLAGAVFMLAGHDRRKGKFSALIHGVPWGRSKIVGMRIEKARP